MNRTTRWIMQLACGLGALSMLPASAQNPYFKDVTDGLDKGGTFFSFMGMGSFMSEAEEILAGLAPLMEDGMVPPDEARMIADLVKKAYVSSGIKSVGALGSSQARLPDGSRRSRMILRQGEGDGLIWNLLDQNVMPSLYALPADTVYGASYSLRLDRLYTWIEELSKGTPAEEGFAEATGQVAQMVDLPRALKSVDGLTLGLRMHPTATLDVPGPDGEAMKVPRPGVIMQLKLNEPYLADFLNQMSAQAGMPIETNLVDAVKVRTLALPPDAAPMPLSPSWAFVNGNLVVAETKEALISMVTGGTPTLASDETFQSYAKNAGPAQAAIFVSPRFSREYAEVISMIQETAMAQNPDAEAMPEAFKELFASGAATQGEDFGLFSQVSRSADRISMTSREVGKGQAFSGLGGGAVMAAILAPALGKMAGQAQEVEMQSNGKNIYTAIFADAIDVEIVGFPTTQQGYTGATAWFQKVAGIGGGRVVVAAAPEFVKGLGQAPAASWAEMKAANVGWSVVLDCGLDTDAGVPFLISSNLKIKTLGDDWEAAVDRGPPYNGKVILAIHGGGAQVLQPGTLNQFRDNLPASYLKRSVLQP